MQTRFDGYTATTRAAKGEEFFSMLLHPGDKFKHGRGHHGFEHRASFSGEDGSEAAAVSWGGMHRDLVMVEVKGDRTPRIVEKIRSRYEHRCTRVDSCYDVEEGGAFEKMLSACMEVKKQFRLKGSKAGDWEDFPEDGRTLYLGSEKSPVRSRLYDKGREPKHRHLNRPDWARLEVQVRPKNDEAKRQYATVDSLSVWGASPWTRSLAGTLLQVELAPLPAGTKYALSSQERALRFMCKQYGAHLIGLHNDLGSWEEVGLKLAEMVKAERALLKALKR